MTQQITTTTKLNIMKTIFLKVVNRNWEIFYTITKPGETIIECLDRQFIDWREFEIIN